MQNVLVTGATGFIGRQLIAHLQQQNVSIRALVRDTKKVFSLQKPLSLMLGDLTVPDSLSAACSQIDTVFHLGGVAHAWDEKSADSTKAHSINFQGTAYLLEKAIQAKVKRFIFFSSVKAVGEHPFCVDENCNKPPDTPYGIAKKAAEEIVLAAKDTGIHVCVLRPALVYGPHWKGNLASMLRAIDRGYFPPLPPIDNVRSMISIRDLCQAACLAARMPAANGQTYFVTDAISYSTQQVEHMMRLALNKSIPRWHIPTWMLQLTAHAGDVAGKMLRRRLPFDSQTLSKLLSSAHYSNQRIQDELGFIPNDTFANVLPDIIAEYKKDRLSCKNHT